MKERQNQDTDSQTQVCIHVEEWMKGEIKEQIVRERYVKRNERQNGETDSQRQVSEEWEKDKIKVQMARNR